MSSDQMPHPQDAGYYPGLPLDPLVDLRGLEFAYDNLPYSLDVEFIATDFIPPEIAINEQNSAPSLTLGSSAEPYNSGHTFASQSYPDPYAQHCQQIDRFGRSIELPDHGIRPTLYYNQETEFEFLPISPVQQVDDISRTTHIPAFSQAEISATYHPDIPNDVTLANTCYPASNPLLSLPSQLWSCPGAEGFQDGLTSLDQEALLLFAENAKPHLAGPSDTAFDVPEEAIYRPAEALRRAEGSIHHDPIIPESDIIDCFKGNRRKCTRGGRKVRRQLRKDPTKPYTCTSRCGQMFSRRDHWKRHEEANNFAQKVWICSCDKCRSKSLGERAHFREDNARKHVRSVHKAQPLSKHVTVVTEYVIPKNYSRHCFLQQCTKMFKSWSHQCKHIARHMEREPWDELEWRSLEHGMEQNADKVTGSSGSEDSGQTSSLSHNRDGRDGSESGAGGPGPHYGSRADRDPGPDSENHSTFNQHPHTTQGSQNHEPGHFSYAFERRSGDTIQRSMLHLDFLRLDLTVPFETPTAELRPGIKRLEGDHHSSDKQSSLDWESDHQKSSTLDHSIESIRESVHTAIFSARGTASSYSMTTMTSSDLSVPKRTAGLMLGSSRRPTEVSHIKGYLGIERYLASYDPLEIFLVTGQSYRPQRNIVLQKLIANFDELVIPGDTKLLPDKMQLMDPFSDLGSFEEAGQTWWMSKECSMNIAHWRQPNVSQSASSNSSIRNEQLAEATHDRVLQFPHFTIRDKIRASRAPYNNLFCSDINFGIPACISEVRSRRTGSTHTKDTSGFSQGTACGVDRKARGFMLQRFVDQHPKEEPFDRFLAGVRLDVDLSAKKALQVDEWLSSMERDVCRREAEEA